MLVYIGSTNVDDIIKAIWHTLDVKWADISNWDQVTNPISSTHGGECCLNPLTYTATPIVSNMK